MLQGRPLMVCALLEAFALLGHYSLAVRHNSLDSAANRSHLHTGCYSYRSHRRTHCCWHCCCSQRLGCSMDQLTGQRLKHMDRKLHHRDRYLCLRWHLHRDQLRRYLSRNLEQPGRFVFFAAR